MTSQGGFGREPTSPTRRHDSLVAAVAAKASGLEVDVDAVRQEVTAAARQRFYGADAAAYASRPLLSPVRRRAWGMQHSAPCGS